MVTPQTIQEILSSPRGTAVVGAGLREHGDGSRAALASYVCERLDLKDRQGQPRRAGGHKALRVLEVRGAWTLPASKGPAWHGWQPGRRDAPVPPPEGVPERVDAVAGLRLIEVTADDDELFRVWNELMLSEHRLGDCRLVGRQMRYLIGSDHGWLGGLGFGSCALRLRERDAWIGWDEPTRKQFRERVINLTRFLIRPCVSCQHLASRVLSLGMKRVATDFFARYGFAPWLVETFVDPVSFSGTSFGAANWIHVGTTAGRGRNAPNHPVTSRKDIYLYPLRPDWRAAMGVAAPGAELARGGRAVGVVQRGLGGRRIRRRCLRAYNLRWRTEEWYRLLKSGCAIEAHQHQTAERLARAITIDTVVGWRVMLLTVLGREAPDLPCELIFSSHECKLLETLQPRVAPETMAQEEANNGLTLGSAYIIIGRLGGALHRNAKELPGHQTVMRGLLRFHDMTLALSLDRGG